MVITKEYWDLGEVPSSTQQWPRHNEKCLGKILYALIELKGQMLSVQVDKGRFAKGKAPVTMRIELPFGKKEEFEAMTGFPLTRPPEVVI